MTKTDLTQADKPQEIHTDKSDEDDSLINDMIWRAQEMMNDKLLLDFMEKTGGINGLSILNDDNGHWAVSDEGIQPVVTGKPQDLQQTFYTEKKMWKKSIREAIRYYIENNKEIK